MKAVCPSVNLCIPIEGIFYPLLSRSFYFLNGIINYKEAKSGFFFPPHLLPLSWFRFKSCHGGCECNVELSVNRSEP